MFSCTKYIYVLGGKENHLLVFENKGNKMLIFGETEAVVELCCFMTAGEVVSEYSLLAAIRAYPVSTAGKKLDLSGM